MFVWYNVLMNGGKRIVIVGGGFAGVKAALELSKKNISGLKIVLISDRKNFEYHGALYRLATGGTPMEVCFPIREIIDTKKVEFVIDKITTIDSKLKQIEGKSGSCYKYDTLILGMGLITSLLWV